MLQGWSRCQRVSYPDNHGHRLTSSASIPNFFPSTISPSSLTNNNLASRLNFNSLSSILHDPSTSTSTSFILPSTGSPLARRENVVGFVAFPPGNELSCEVVERALYGKYEGVIYKGSKYICPVSQTTSIILVFDPYSLYKSLTRSRLLILSPLLPNM